MSSFFFINKNDTIYLCYLYNSLNYFFLVNIDTYSKYNENSVLSSIEENSGRMKELEEQNIMLRKQLR